MAKSSATSSPCARAAWINLRKPSSPPSSACTSVCPPSAAPIAYGLPGSPSTAVTELLRPLRFFAPIGWIGGMYSTSKFIARICASRLITSSKLPCRCGSPLCERGNNSYQLAKCAARRSDSTRKVTGVSERNGLSSAAAIACAVSGSSTIASCCSGSLCAPMRVRTACRRSAKAPLLRACAACTTATASCTSTGSTVLAARFFSRSACKVANTSRQPSTRNS